MAGTGQPPRSDKPSIKYRFKPLEGAFFELVDLDNEDYAPISSKNNKQNGKVSELKSTDILSTADLISAIGLIWDCATGPLSVFQPKTSLKSNTGDRHKRNMFCYPAEEGNVRTSASPEGQCFSVNLMTTSCSSPMVQSNLECLTVTQKMSFFEPCRGSHVNSIFWGFLHSGSNTPIESCKEKGLASVRISYDLGNVYGWMTKIALAGPKHQENSTEIDKKKTGDCYTAGDNSSPASCCISGDTSSPANKLITGSADSHTEITKPLDSSSVQSAKFIATKSASISFLYSDYFLKPAQDIQANGSAFRTPISRRHVDNYVNVLASGTTTCEESQDKTEDDYLHENKKNAQKAFLTEDKSKIEICSSTGVKPRYALAKQQHAFAGALAGIFVSLCLHPVDTIKTVTQSCRTDQKSLHYISRSIISERGVTGLYRGIPSNIASSAPISAVYTFTYESVKGALLSLFPKEYHSLAHCMAGGCASIATSFIFTPSERIKQQMQVGSHYQNCWNALIGIVKKGGFSSLYAGWGAVLCRNVPHSIIKFYTYESLRQLMLSSFQSNAQPNTLQTLVCGGLAASTAALFTTPFDVVKTRLQTQIPGSMNQYDGVFNTLKEIAKNEGLKGLYRGLTPRLIMYATQGALFFASYESFKRLFSLEVPQLNAKKIQYEHMEDDLTATGA